MDKDNRLTTETSLFVGGRWRIENSGVLLETQGPLEVFVYRRIADDSRASYSSSLASYRRRRRRRRRGRHCSILDRRTCERERKREYPFSSCTQGYCIYNNNVTL